MCDERDRVSDEQVRSAALKNRERYERDDDPKIVSLSDWQKSSRSAQPGNEVSHVGVRTWQIWTVILIVAAAATYFGV